MKSPDEIKKGLGFCAKPDHPVLNKCEFCLYGAVPGCERALKIDALAYIQQLERELNAAVEGLGKMRWCSMCKNSGTDDLTCITCKYPQDVYPTFRPNWEWRGVQNNG